LSVESGTELFCFPEKEVSARKLGFIDLFTGNEDRGMY
jgi:hypothetical protein